MSNIIPVPDDIFKDETGIRWIACRKWATGGSASPTGFANSGVLNEPVQDLLGNTKFLKSSLDSLQESHNDHLLDSNAHSDAILAKLASGLSSWQIPPEKIKSSLTEQNGITDDDVQAYDPDIPGSGLREVKLHLDLRGKPRPQLIAEAGSTYLDTGEMARDLMALYWRSSAHSSTMFVLSRLGQFLSLSGWSAQVPLLTDRELNESFGIDGNVLSLRRENKGTSYEGGGNTSNVVVSGIPLNIGAGEPYSDIIELGSGDSEYFKDLSSPNLYTSSEPSRQDLAFIEFWTEDVPSDLGRILPNGNVMSGNNRSAGYDGIRYRQTSDGIPSGDPGFESAINNPDYLVFSDEAGRVCQGRYRFRLERGKKSLTDCSPQGHLPVPADAAQTSACEYSVTSVLSGNRIVLSDQSAELYTGNVVTLALPVGGGSIPTGLDLGVEYYVIRPSSLDSGNIQLASTYDNCFYGTPISITPGSCNFIVKISVKTHQDVEITEDVVADLFSSCVQTGEQWDTGTPVRIVINENDKVSTNLPTFYPTATYYIVPKQAGWVALYQHETYNDTTTPLLQVSFQTESGEPPTGQIKISFVPDGEIVSDGSVNTETEFIQISEHTLDPASGYLRSSKEWAEKQPVSVSVEPTPGYIHTQQGPLSTEKIYYVSRVNDVSTGAYSGIRLCASLNDAVIGKGMDFVDSRFASAMLIRRAHVFAETSPGTGIAFVSSNSERTISHAIPLFKIHRRNAGVFDPIHNPNGCAMAAQGSIISSLSDCFTDSKIAAYDPVKKEFGAWSLAVSESAESGLDSTLNVIQSEKNLVVLKEWQAGTEVQFTLTSNTGSLPGGIEAGKSYWILGSPAVYQTTKFTIQLASTKTSLEPIDLVPDTGTFLMACPAEDFRKRPGGGVFYRTGYSCFKERQKTSSGGYFGISGRPDGLFYDVADPMDLVDLRSQVVMDGADLSAILSRNLDLMFRGAPLSGEYEQLLSDGQPSGIKGTAILQTDVLDDGTLFAPIAGSVVDKRRSQTSKGKTVFSYDLLDGLRRYWSDAPVVQGESEVVIFGSSLGEVDPDDAPNPQGSYPDYLDLSSDDGVGVVLTSNFASSGRLGSSVSPGALLDIDYKILKYRSLENGGSNKIALIGVKMERGGMASGDFYGASSDDTLRVVRFEPSTSENPYRVIDLHEETLDGVSQTLKTDLQVEAVSLRNEGRTAEINVTPFRFAKPLQHGKTYYIFAHPDGNGYYQLAESLAPAIRRETLSFVVDAPSSFDSGIVLSPVFSGRREAVRRKVTLDITNSALFVRAPIPTGTAVSLSLPEDYSGLGITYSFPPNLPEKTVFYVVEDGRTSVGGEYRYKIRLAASKKDAHAGNYLSFGEDAGDAGDLFFLDADLQYGISAALAYPSSLRVSGGVGAESFSQVLTGTPVRLIPSGSDRLPSPLSPDVVYYAVKVSDSEIRLCADPKDILSESFIEFTEASSVLLQVAPVLSPVNIHLPASPILLSGSDSRWYSGTPVRILGSDAAGLNYIDENGDTFSLSGLNEIYAISVDSKRFRLATSLAKVVNREFDVSLVSDTAGVVTSVPRSVGIVGVVENVDVQGTSVKMIKLQGMNFVPSIGFKTRVTELPDAVAPAGHLEAPFHELPGTLSVTTDYYMSPYQGGGSDVYVELAQTYQDAYNRSEGYGNPSVVDLSNVLEGTKIQFVGYPARLTKGITSTLDIGGSDLVKGTPVVVDYYSDAASHYGRNFPTGLSRHRVYAASAITDGKFSLFDSLRDSILDELGGGSQQVNPISLENVISAPLFFKVSPTASFEEVSYLSDHRLLEMVIPEEWSTKEISGTPLKVSPSVHLDDFPIVSGILADTVYYAARTGSNTLGLTRTLEQAINLGQSDLVTFNVTGQNIDQDAYLEIVPQPVNAVGDPVTSYSVNTDLVDPQKNTLTLTGDWKTGTPVYFNPFAAGSMGEDIQINATYYIVVRRVVDPNTPTLEVGLTDTLEAAHLMESRESITSFGQGSARIVSLNRAEVIYTSGNGVVITDSFHNSGIRNSIQTSQEWETCTPVRIQNVGSGRLPQFYEYGLQPSSVGVHVDLPVLEVNSDQDTLSDTGKPASSVWNGVLGGGEAVIVEEVGNDIPSGLSSDQIYYVTGVSVSYEGAQQKSNFKLASSFHTALLGFGSDFRTVSKDGTLSLSSWQPPESETVSLGSGYLDLSNDTIKVRTPWPTGVPVTLIPSGSSVLPQGLDSNSVYFTYAFSSDKIQVLGNLPDYYRFKLGDNFASSLNSPVSGEIAKKQVPEEIPSLVMMTYPSVGASQVFNTTTAFDSPVIDSLIGGGEAVRLWISGQGGAEGISAIDKIRFGSRDILPPSGSEFFPYRKDGIHAYIEISIPSYPQDSLVEVSARKKTADGGYLWSPPIMFMYVSEKAPVLLRVTPGAVFPGWNLSNVSPEYWQSFEGKVSLLFYAPNGYFENQGVAVKLQHYAVGNTKPLPSAYDSDFIADFSGPSESPMLDKNGSPTPLRVVSFSYTPPTLEHVGNIVTGEVLVMSSEISLVSNDTNRNILSTNTLSFTNLSRLDAEVPFFLTSSAPKSFSSPENDQNKDIVFGYTDHEAWIRLVVPGYTGSTALITFEEANSGVRETRTAYASTEYWNGVSEENILETLYVRAPKRSTASHTLKVYFANNPDVAVEIPYMESPAPFIGHSGSVSTQGGIEYEFQGSNLDKINSVYLINNVPDISQDYMKRQEVSILSQSEHSISVFVPPMSYPNDKVSSSDITESEIAFCAPEHGTAVSPFIYRGKSYKTPTPRISTVTPQSLSGEAYLEGETPAVRTLLGQAVLLSGKHLESVVEVHIKAYPSSGAFVTGKGPENDTYIIRDIAVSKEGCWFYLPEMVGITAHDGADCDAKFIVGVVDKYGVSTFDVFGDSNAPVMKIRRDANYESLPVVSSVTPAFVENHKESMVVLRGRNLSGATSIQFGTQYFNDGQFTVTQGIGEAPDTLSFTSKQNNDSGIMPVIVKTLHGGVSRFTSAPAYFEMRNRHYVEFVTEGSGEFEISPKSWTTETILPGKVSLYHPTNSPYGMSLIEASQNLPTGLPVRFSATGSNVLPDGIEEGRVYYVVNSGMRKIALRGKRTGLPIQISVPNIPEAVTATVTSVSGTAHILTANAALTNWFNGMEVFFKFSAAPPSGVTENTSYWVSDLNVGGSNKFKILDAPGGSVVPIGAYSTSFKTYPVLGSVMSVVDLPTMPDPQNPSDTVVDWSQDISRFVERIPMDAFHIDASGSIVVRSNFWDSSKTIGFNPYYPPFLGKDEDVLPFNDRTAAALPTGGRNFAHENWDESYLSSTEEDLEYVINPTDAPSFLLAVSPSFLGSVSPTPMTIDLTVQSGTVGFTMEVVDDLGYELFESNQINPATNSLQTEKNVGAGEWRVGMPVRLGSKIPTPLVDGGIYYNNGDSSQILLSENQGTGENIVDVRNDGYGFIRLTKTYAEFSRDDVYYVENIGGGRVRVYKTLADILGGNHLRLTSSNETGLLIRPVMEPGILNLGSTGLDLSSDEILTGNEGLLTGTPVRFYPQGDESVLPEGIDEGTTYYVYKTSPDSATLYRSWSDVATLDGHVMSLAKGTSTVTMRPDFSGERVRQLLSPGEDGDHIDLNGSRIHLKLSGSHSNPEGTPVRLVSNKPVLGKDEMSDPLRSLDLRFKLRYGGGCGLTDRVINPTFEGRGEVSDGVKTFRDTYIVEDPRFDCISTGASPYWKQDSLPQFSQESLSTFMDEENLPKSRWNHALNGFFKSVELFDAILPKPVSFAGIPVDESTISFKNDNAFMGYEKESGEYTFSYDDFLPANLKNRDLYVGWVAMRIDEVDPSTKLLSTTYAGLPVQESDGVSYDNAAVLGKIQVLWNKDSRTIKFTGITEYIRLSFRVGICSVDYTNNTSIPGYTGGSYSGAYDVGLIYQAKPQCKEISLVGVKRVLRTKDAGDGFGWGPLGTVLGNPYSPNSLLPEKSRGFRDVWAYSWTAWTESGVDEGETPTEFHLTYVDPTDAGFEGEGDLYLGSQITSGSFELLYFAGGENNPVPVTPLGCLSGKCFVYYQRNPWKFEFSDGDITAILPNQAALVSTAGSGNYRPEGLFGYPHLAFHVPTPDLTYSYKLSAKIVDAETGKLITPDPSYVRIPVLGLADQGRNPSTPERTGGVAGGAPRLSSDGSRIVSPSKDSVIPILYPRIDVKGSASITVLPNLYLDGNHLKGVLFVNNGTETVEARFNLYGNPVMRPNTKGL